MIPHSRPTITPDDVRAVNRSLKTGMLAQGRQVEKFEHAVARFLNLKHGIALSSGTAALHLALLALNVKAGDEVLIPTYVCSALMHAVRNIGGKPVLLDTDPNDLSLNVSEIRNKKTRKTRALIFAHPFGYPLELSEILRLGIPVIEDIAPSIGAKLNRKKVGNAGKLTITSFYATKMLTTGEGGMVLTDSKSLAGKVRSYRCYDEQKNWHDSFNYKMTDFQGALGLSQLKKILTFLQRRREIARRYDSFLKQFRDVSLPELPKGARPSWHRFLFRHPEGERIIRQLNQKGIAARKPVFKPLHQYSGVKNFPGANLLHREMVSLPVYPSLTHFEIKTILSALEKILR